MELKNMTSQHVAQVAALEKVCFSDPWSEKSVASELTNPLSTWIVAVDGDTVVGYVGAQTCGDETDMMNVAVDPNYRRCGIARQLIEALIQQLQDRGSHSLTLEVRVTNMPAVTLNGSMGFEKVGLRKNYYRNPKEDALILRKAW
jgi:ribosomal-protein-alanine N-acetyltransferase